MQFDWTDLCFWNDMIGLQLDGKLHTQFGGEGVDGRERSRRQYDGMGTQEFSECLERRKVQMEAEGKTQRNAMRHA